MKSKSNKAAGSPSTPQQRSPRNALFFGLCALLAATVTMTYVPSQAVVTRALNSVVFVDTEIEREIVDNPFSFLFGYGCFGPGSTVPISLIDPAPKRTEITHSYGTAFFLERRLVTARHVIVSDRPSDKVRKITITTYDGESREATVVRDDKATDLAELCSSLMISRDSLKLASRAPVRGDEITEIGNPALIRFVVSKGQVVGFDRSQGYNIAAIDTFGGNSGGPDLNSNGQVVGVTHTLIMGSRFTGIGTLQQLRAFLYPDETR